MARKVAESSRNCGAELAPDSAFCTPCRMAVTNPAASPAPRAVPAASPAPRAVPLGCPAQGQRAAAEPDTQPGPAHARAEPGIIPIGARPGGPLVGPVEAGENAQLSAPAELAAGVAGRRLAAKILDGVLPAILVGATRVNSPLPDGGHLPGGYAPAVAQALVPRQAVPGQASPFAPQAAPAISAPDAGTGFAEGPISTVPHSTPAPHDPALHGPALHGRALHGRALHGRALHGRALHGRALHGRALHCPALHEPAPSDPAPHGPAPYMTAGGGPDSLTPADSVAAVADDLGDTRLRPAAASGRLSLACDDGTTEVVGPVARIGRSPAGYDGEMIEHLVPIRDASRSVSKTHLHVRAAGEGLWLTDKTSTSGRTITNAAGQNSELRGGTPARVEVGAAAHCGDRSFQVGRA